MIGHVWIAKFESQDDPPIILFECNRCQSSVLTTQLVLNRMIRYDNDCDVALVEKLLIE